MVASMLLIAAITVSTACAPKPGPPSTGSTQPPSTAPATGQERPGAISGVVVRTDGAPATHLRLRLVPQSYSVIHPHPKARRRPKLTSNGISCTCDEAGRFTFADVPPDAYVLIGGSEEIGWIYREVVVESGEQVQLSIKLAFPLAATPRG